MATLGVRVDDRTQQQQPPGTLQSEGLYYQPKIPGQSDAAGIQGSDGRAYTGNVQGNELVENRLTNLLDRGGSYISNARSRGLQGAAKRGMLNSSIAQGAAERSAIEAGMPIASADAQTYLQTRMQNQQDLNQNLMQERDIANRMLEGQLGRQSAIEAYQEGERNAAAERALRLQLQRENLAFEGEQQGLSRQQQEMMQRLGYTQDLGRMGAEFGYDLGRTGYQFDLQDRNSGRDWQRSMVQDENRYANARYDRYIDSDLRQYESNMDLVRDMLMNDPSISPADVDGFMQFMSYLGGRGIDDTLSRFGLGYGG